MASFIVGISKDIIYCTTLFWHEKEENFIHDFLEVFTYRQNRSAFLSTEYKIWSHGFRMLVNGLLLCDCLFMYRLGMPE